MKITITRDGERVLGEYASAFPGHNLALVAASGAGLCLTLTERRDDDLEVLFNSNTLLVRGDLVGMLDNSVLGLSTSGLSTKGLVVRRPQPYPFGSVEEIVEIDSQLEAKRVDDSDD
jgi:hypothetical protein